MGVSGNTRVYVLIVTLHGKTGIKVIARTQHVYTARLVCPKTRFMRIFIS